MNPNQALLGSALALIFILHMAVAVPPFLFDGYGSEGEKSFFTLFITHYVYIVDLLNIIYVADG